MRFARKGENNSGITATNNNYILCRKLVVKRSFVRQEIGPQIMRNNVVMFLRRFLLRNKKSILDVFLIIAT